LLRRRNFRRVFLTALSRITKQASLSLRRSGELQDDRAEFCRWSLSLAICAITVSCFVHSFVALSQPAALVGKESKEKFHKGNIGTLEACIVSDSQNCLIQYNITFPRRVVRRDWIVLGLAL
jgi:hypothetical protein